MTEKLELYKCDICGNLVQVILPGVGELVCCGEAMHLLKAQTEEEGKTDLATVFQRKDHLGAPAVEDPLLERRLVRHDLVEHALVVGQLANELKNQRHVRALGFSELGFLAHL